MPTPTPGSDPAPIFSGAGGVWDCRYRDFALTTGRPADAPLDLTAALKRIGTCRVIASVSGGKDSGATCLHLQELGIPYEPVFLDTGWELPETLFYLREVLPAYIGEIRWLRAEVALPADVEPYALELEGMLGHYSAMVRMCLKKIMLPARKPRWCTSAVKVDVMNDWIATTDADVVNVVGVRGAESPDRAAMDEWEYDAKREAWVWRPIHGWTLDDVIAIHQRHGMRPNPLYLLNMTRVGCGPCIFSRKAEIRFLADRYPERIAVIRRLEEIMAILYAKTAAGQGLSKNLTSASARKGIAYLPPTWFQHNSERTEAMRETGYAWPIDRVVEWSRTAWGGKQVELFAAPPPRSRLYAMGYVRHQWGARRADRSRVQ